MNGVLIDDKRIKVDFSQMLVNIGLILKKF